MDPRTRASRPDDVLLHVLDDGAGLGLRLPTEEYFELDPVATAMYRAAVRAPSIAAAVAALAEEFDAEPDRLERDVLALLDSLQASGLIKLERQD